MHGAGGRQFDGDSGLGQLTLHHTGNVNLNIFIIINFLCRKVGKEGICCVIAETNSTTAAWRKQIVVRISSCVISIRLTYISLPITCNNCCYYPRRLTTYNFRLFSASVHQSENIIMTSDGKFTHYIIRLDVLPYNSAVTEWLSNACGSLVVYYCCPRRW